MDEYTKSLLAVTVLFACSLVAAFVLFKWVKSFASVEGQGGFGLKVKGFQAGGAIAGFLLTYGLLDFSFNRLMTNSTPELWTISGEFEQGQVPPTVSVFVSPPEPVVKGHTFKLINVRKIDGEFPKLGFESDVWIDPIEITPESADINEKKCQITLKRPVPLHEVDTETLFADSGE